MSDLLVLSDLILEQKEIENNLNQLNKITKNKINLIDLNYKIDNENIKLNIIKQIIIIVKIRNELLKRI